MLGEALGVRGRTGTVNRPLPPRVEPVPARFFTKLTVTRWRDTWTLPAAEVRRIERQDPLENGIWRGFAVGAVLVYGSCISPLSTEALCGTGSDSQVLGYLSLLVHGLPYTTLGAVAGGLVDAFTHTTL